MSVTLPLEPGRKITMQIFLCEITYKSLFVPVGFDESGPWKSNGKENGPSPLPPLLLLPPLLGWILLALVKSSGRSLIYLPEVVSLVTEG